MDEFDGGVGFQTAEQVGGIGGQGGVVDGRGLAADFGGLVLGEELGFVGGLGEYGEGVEDGQQVFHELLLADGMLRLCGCWWG
jgi:hypothetical protein